MERFGWTALSCGLVRWLFEHGWYSGAARQRALRILAIVAPGPNRLVLQSVSRDAGWALTLSEEPPGNPSGRQADVPAIVLYDRELSPSHWSEIVRVLTNASPRPYVILLSPSTDNNLWDELQRVGGSDIVRTPIDRSSVLSAVKRAWLLHRSQEQVRLSLSNRV